MFDSFFVCLVTVLLFSVTWNLFLVVWFRGPYIRLLKVVLSSPLRSELLIGQAIAMLLAALMLMWWGEWYLYVSIAFCIPYFFGVREMLKKLSVLPAFYPGVQF